MHNKKLQTWFAQWLLTVCLALGGIGCLVTGLDLQAVYFANAVMWCILFTAAWIAVGQMRRGWILQLCFVALVAGYILRTGSALSQIGQDGNHMAYTPGYDNMMLQIEALLYRISEVYDRNYGCGVVMWSGYYLLDVPLMKAVALLVCLEGAVLASLLKQPKLNFFAVALGAAPLLACLPLTDSAPGGFWMWLLLSSLLLLVLTGMVRRRSQTEAIRLTALLLVPVCLFTLLLQCLNPRDKYENNAANLDQTILGWLEELPFVVEGPDGMLQISFSGTSSDGVNLRNVGPKSDAGHAVMEVVSTIGGTLYLREQSFDVYDGGTWNASWDNYPAKGWTQSFNLVQTGSVSISTRTARQNLFLPYYADLAYINTMNLGGAPNVDSLREYTMTVYEMRDADVYSALSYSQRQQYTKINSNLQQRLLPYLKSAGLDGAATVDEIAKRICKLVKNSATYSLDTPKMDKNSDDFVLWFLKDSDTGYCVHFATAATMLLRAAGVPARYVTGYVCNAVEGQRVTVTSDMSHAWVEYFSEEQNCWVVLESTPGFSGLNTGSGGTEQEATKPTDPPGPTTPALPTEPTEPEVTEPSETPTDPTEETQASTKPTEPEESKPADPTAPTEPSGVGGGEGPGILMENWEQLWKILLMILGIGGFAGALIGQYVLRRRWRVKKMTTGNPNQQALAMWQEIQRYVRLLKHPVPKDMQELAEKAKFSQHTLRKEELAQMRLWLAKAQKRFAAKPLPVRWLYQLIWAVK